MLGPGFRIPNLIFIALADQRHFFINASELTQRCGEQETAAAIHFTVIGATDQHLLYAASVIIHRGQSHELLFHGHPLGGGIQPKAAIMRLPESFSQD